MNPFTWNDDQHSVGIPEIDADHRAVFRMAEDLHDAISNGTAHDGLDGLLARLTSYSKFHFPMEESMMRQTGFPACAEHEREHESFSLRISQIRTVKRKADMEAAAALMGLLRIWLEHHICGEDRRVVEHYKRQELSI